MSTAESQDDLVITLRRAAQAIYDRRSIREMEVMLSQIVEAAVDAVPGAAGGGISRTESGTVRYSHATDPVVSHSTEVSPSSTRARASPLPTTRPTTG